MKVPILIPNIFDHQFTYDSNSLNLDKEKTKADKYKKPAITYKKERPKYIELYSKKPPNIAPKIFDDKA